MKNQNATGEPVKENILHGMWTHYKQVTFGIGWNDLPPIQRLETERTYKTGVGHTLVKVMELMVHENDDDDQKSSAKLTQIMGEVSEFVSKMNQDNLKRELLRQ